MDPETVEPTTRLLTFDSPLGKIDLAETDGAIVVLTWPGTDGRDETPLLTDARAQVLAYFAGDLMDFTLPLRPAGSRFQRAVWARIAAIPFGHTHTYGDLARYLGASPRAVGRACGENPLPLVVPCHRVTAGDGSLGGYSGHGGQDSKTFLLDLEARVSGHAGLGPLFSGSRSA